MIAPITEPAVGYGAAGALVFIDRGPPGSPRGAGRPNIAPVGLAATDNGTRATFAANLGAWQDNRLRTIVGLADADVNLDFFGFGGDRVPGREIGYRLAARGGCCWPRSRRRSRSTACRSLLRSAFGSSGITDTDVLFVRNNLTAPNASIVEDPDAWKLEIDGVSSPGTLTVADLKRMGLTTVAMVLQCSGNGRGFFKHKASGSQWKVGAAGNVLWSGVPVKDVVAALGGVREDMRYMTSTGGETIPSGLDPEKVIVERSVPWTAMEDAILAWELNGASLPLAHGGPLRVLIPGYYGVNNVKYVKRLAFTVDETAANIQKSGYRVRDIGTKGDPTQPSMWEMNLKSFVTHPSEDGQTLRAGLVQVHGVAFSGASPVRDVEVSVDGGKTWQTARFIGPHMGRHAWRQFVAQVNLPAGKYTITSRAIAADGSTQPELRVENERAYAHNGWRDHAIEVNVS